LSQVAKITIACVFLSACSPLVTALGTGSLAYNIATQNMQGIATGTLGKVIGNPFEEDQEQEDQEQQQSDSVEWNFQ
tara:strand:+ start:2530 stop:2760 length:231 start_codon:yes stop_codon:yes gene_type:complete